MKPLHRNLLIILGVTVVVYGGLLWVGRSMSRSGADDSNYPVVPRQGPRASAEPRKLSSVEAQELLKKIVIPSVNLEDASLAEALEFVNAEIAKQIPEGQPRPKVMIDPVFLKSDREAYEAAQAGEELLEALGGIELKPISELEIEELRVRNIPAEVLLKYISDATKVYYYIYRGDVYMTIGCEACSMHSFYNDKVFDRIQMEGVRLDHLVAKLDDIIDSCEFRGPKAGISIRMSEKARQALKRNEIPMPVISLDLSDVTLNQVVTTIAQQSEGALMARAAEFEGLVYDPLNEGIGTLDDPLHPDQDTKPGGRFDIPLDENWAKPPSASEPIK